MEGFYIVNQTIVETIEAIAEVVARLLAPLTAGRGSGFAESFGALVESLGALGALGALVESSLGALGALVEALIIRSLFLRTCDCSLARTVATSAKSSTMMDVDFILFLFCC